MDKGKASSTGYNMIRRVIGFNKRVLYGVTAYLVLSIMGLFLVDDRAFFPHWPLHAVSGPLWHLALFVKVCQSPFHYLDGVVRITDDMIFMALLTLTVWSGGGILLGYILRKHNSPLNVYERIAFVVAWFAVGVWNVYRAANERMNESY